MARAAGGGGSALLLARLTGDGTALGRHQRSARHGGAAARRLTGGHSTVYGDGLVSACAILPHPWAWLDEDPRPPGARLLNRYARGVVSALARLGLRAMYPGRDFVTAARRRAAYVTAERDASGAFLFQAVVGVTRPYAPVPDPPGLRALPPVTDLARELGDASDERLEEALVAGFAGRFGLDPVEADPPEVGGGLPPPCDPADPPLDGMTPGRAVTAPIGALEAFARLDSGGRVERVHVAGDWIAGSADVRALEASLVGARDGDVDRVVRGWLAAPDRLAIGVPDPAPLVEALRDAVRAAG